MSACIILASNAPLAEYLPSQEYPVHIDIDKGIVDDGGADENYSILAFDNVNDYTDKDYGVILEWNYTDGRAKQLIEYIKTALKNTDCVEFWHVWLTDYYEFEDRPYIHKKIIAISELTEEHIREIYHASIWNTPDKRYPQRPSFYCLTIIK